MCVCVTTVLQIISTVKVGFTLKKSQDTNDLTSKQVKQTIKFKLYDQLE